MKTLLLIALIFVMAVSAIPALAETFVDGFEGTSIGSYWTPSTNYDYRFGVRTTPMPTISSDQAHSGSQALTLISNGYTGALVTHDYATLQKGTISVWMYDAYPGIRTRYVALRLFNSTAVAGSLGSDFGITTDDSSANTYRAETAGGSNPMVTPRTLGWHHLEIKYASNAVEQWLDGSLMQTVTGDFGFDQVQLSNGGWPYDLQTATYYFDDFSANTYSVPEPSSLLALITGGFALCGYAVRRRK